jgi:ADP-heptose:LPS heptosyltransferase
MRILFARTDRLGDVLLNLPAVAALRAGGSGNHVTLLVQPELAVLLEGLPILDGLIAYRDDPARPWWRKVPELAALMRRQHFDAAVISNPKKELHAAAAMAGIPIRVGYGRKWGWLLTRRIRDAKGIGERHEVDYNYDLVRALGWPAASPPWRWPRLEREADGVRRLLASQGIRPSDPLLAVHPWTSHPRKQWPLPRYRELIRQAAGRLPERVALIGGPEERGRLEELAPLQAGVADLVGRLSLRELAALLQRARLLVSNDSGPAHLAAAVGTRTVVLFGTTDPATGPGRWGPWGEGHAVICRPSMEAIALEEVIAAVERALNR